MALSCSHNADLARAHWDAWSRQDVAGSLALFSDDAVFAMYVPEHVLPFGGETKGKAAASDRGKMIIQQFEIVTYRGEVTGIDGDKVRGHVDYCFRHRATGEEIDSSMRHVMTVRDGLICRLEEYHDVAKIAAFMRLIAYKA